MKTILTLGSILLIIVLLNGYGCESKSETAKSLEYGDDLKKAIQKFEDNRKGFGEKITEVVEGTEDKLSDEDPSELGQVAEDWELNWDGINERFIKLEKDFSDVGISSESYFTELETLASEIKDENFKQSEKRKNIELKARWTDAYKDAAENMKKIQNLLNDGGDFQRILVASSIRLKIEENITELKSISERAKLLLKDLERFTEEGKKLVG